METSVPLSKIRPPTLSRVVHRPRLIDLLAQNGEKKLILLLGQAAQGKSTLAASFVQAGPVPFGWMNLGEEESDPVNLFRLLVYAIQHAFEASDLSELLHYPALSLGPRAEMPMYRDWSRRLFRTVPGPLQIVLDGLDRLSPEAPAFGLLQVLLAEAPLGTRFLMLSRSRPPLAVERLRIGRECVVLENDQLAFTREETKAFFKEVYALSLPPDRLDAVHRLTEGWVGGLILLAGALEKWNRSPDRALLSDAVLTDLKAGAFRYLGEEIFASLSAEQKDFFIKTSFLDVIDPGFVKGLLPGLDVAAVIEESFNKNLFVQPLHHPGKGWQFRYHQLFRDFLQDKFNASLEAAEKRELFFKAGVLAEAAGDRERAVGYYLDARAYPEAAGVLWRIGPELLREARIGDLKKWLKRLPDELVEENPWLLYFLCMTRRFTATRENIPRLQRCLERFAEEGSLPGQMLATAFLIEALTVGGYHPIPLPAVIQRGEALLAAAAEECPYESGILWFQLGFGHMVCNGDPLKGHWCSQNAHLRAKGCGDRVLQAIAVIHAMETLSWLGEFKKAEGISGEIQKLLENISYPELNAYYLIAYGGFLSLKGELETAKPVVERCRRDIVQHGLIYLYPLALVYQTIVHLGLIEFEEAEKAAREMLHLSTSIGNRVFEGIALLYLSLISYHRGDYEKGKRFIERSQRIFSAQESLAAYHLNGSKIIRSLILSHLEADDGLADQELREALSHFSSVSAHSFTAEAELAIGLRRVRQKKPGEAIKHLKNGFRLAEKMGYTHFLLLSRPDFAEACIRVLEYSIAECTDYASFLLSTHLAEFAAPRLDSLAAHPESRIAGKAREVQKRLRQHAAPVIRVQSFGRFRVWRGDRPLQSPEWKKPQTRKLLKVLVARGGSEIPREVVIEDLWPEMDAAAGVRNLKIALHRLRRALEPELKKGAGSAYIHLRNKRISLDSGCFSIDAQAFLSFAEKGEAEAKAGNPKAALAWLEKAAALYRGEFLEKDLYPPWAQTKRQEFQTRYMAVLAGMAQIHEKLGRTKRAIACCRKIVQADPLMEEAYRKMMLLYDSLGLRNEALRVYAECRQALKTEIDAEPDELTSAIYRRIAAGYPAGEPD